MFTPNIPAGSYLLNGVMTVWVSHDATGAYTELLDAIDTNIANISNAEYAAGGNPVLDDMDLDGLADVEYAAWSGDLSAPRP